VEIENNENILSQSNRAERELTSFNSPLLNKILVSFILLQKAAYPGGFKNQIKVEGIPNSARNIFSIHSGIFIALGYNIWKEAAEKYSEDLFISSPVILTGTFEKGIYGLKSNTALFNIQSLQDLKQCCSIIENSHWQVDHKTISEMNISGILITINHESMVKIVNAGRADFALLEFGGAAAVLSITKYSITLNAVPGFKVALRSSRHYAVSKKHPQRKEFFDALQKGIELLNQHNTFTSALKEIGFINSRVKDWEVIN